MEHVFLYMSLGGNVAGLEFRKQETSYKMYSKVIFSIPLKAKKNSIDWGYALKSLERTVKSIEQQSVKEYLIYIATNDPDEVQEVFGSSVVCIKADFDLPSHGWNRPSADKHKKRRLIASEIKKWLLEECYIMFLDADDLVHKELVRYILEQATTGMSYVVDRGFAMDVGNRRIVEVDEFARRCGSCFIGYYKNEELPLPTPDSLAIDAVSTGNTFHQKFADCRSQGARAKSEYCYAIVPFPAVIYTIGSMEATSHNPLRNLRKTFYFQRWSIRSYLRVITDFLAQLAVRAGIMSSMPRHIPGRLLSPSEIDRVRRDFGLSRD